MSTAPKPIHILVVDDEPGIRELLAYELGAKGYQVTVASNGQEALEKLPLHDFQLIITDVKMPKLGGVEFLDAVKKTAPEIEVIMATGFGTVQTAVEAMKKGAFDFIQKPFNLIDIFALVEKALDRRELKTLMGVYEASKVVFSSEKLEGLLTQIATLCKNSAKADDLVIFLIEDNIHTPNIHVGSIETSELHIRIEACKRMIVQTRSWKNAILIPENLTKDSRLVDVHGIEKIQSTIFFPLIVESQFFGILNVNRTRTNDPFSNADMVTIPIYGAQIAQVLHNAQMYDHLDSKIIELNSTFQKLEETQNQLIQSDKLASLGKMVAGVMHDLNNPLNGILLSAQMFMDDEGLSSQQKEDLDIIVSQSKHCHDVIQTLLQFSRKKGPDFSSLDMSSLIETALKLSKHDSEFSKIKIVCEVENNLPPFLGESTQVQQVLLNLITNARHAMRNSETKTLSIHATKINQFIELTIQDTGCGIPQENLHKIFDPFFTTKPAGEGTGLGLSICRDILQQLGGSLDVTSQLEKGTIFTLKFPILINEGASR